MIKFGTHLSYYQKKTIKQVCSGSFLSPGSCWFISDLESVSLPLCPMAEQRQAKSECSRRLPSDFEQGCLVSRDFK